MKAGTVTSRRAQHALMREGALQYCTLALIAWWKLIICAKQSRPLDIFMHCRGRPATPAAAARTRSAAKAYCRQPAAERVENRAIAVGSSAISAPVTVFPPCPAAAVDELLIRWRPASLRLAHNRYEWDFSAVNSPARRRYRRWLSLIPSSRLLITNLRAIFAPAAPVHRRHAKWCLYTPSVLTRSHSASCVLPYSDVPPAP